MSTATQKKTVPEPEALPTDNEVASAKAEAKVDKMKHVDARTLALDYLFPLMRRLAGEAGDIAEAVEDLTERLDANGGDDELADLLGAARDMIVNMAGLLDQTMVSAGFCTVSKDKDEQIVLSVSDKMPPALRTVYEAIGPEATRVVTDIQEAIVEAEGEGEEGEDEEDEDEEVEDEPTNPGRAAYVAPVAVVAATVAVESLQAAVEDGSRRGRDERRHGVFGRLASEWARPATGRRHGRGGRRRRRRRG